MRHKAIQHDEYRIVGIFDTVSHNYNKDEESSESLENKHFAWDKTYSLKKLANSSDLLFQQ